MTMLEVKRLLVFLAVLICAACNDQETDTRQTKGEASVSGADTPSSESPITEAHNCPDANTCVPMRSSSRWNLIIEGKPELAYAYLAPAYRAIQNRTDYINEMRNRPVTWVSFHYIEHRCESADSCNVTVQIDAKLHMSKTKDVETRNQVSEHWVRSEGNWYFVPHPRR